MKYKIVFSLFLIAGILYGTERKWAFVEMPYRTNLAWTPAEGRNCELSLDFDLLSRMAEKKIPAEIHSIRLAADTPDGQKPVPLVLTGREGNILHLRFVLPASTKVPELYFGGKSDPRKEEAVPRMDLISGAIEPKGWTPLEGKWTVSSQAEGLFLSTGHINTARICKDFPISAESVSGSSVVLDFAIRSLSTISWNFSLWVHQLDAEGRLLASSATDPRWSTFNIPVSGKIALRTWGHLDPRAKTIRLELKTVLPRTTVDVYGKPFPSGSRNVLNVVFTKLQLRIAQKISFPGRNPDFFAEGIDGGRAFHLNGKRAPFFNANPPCVWAEGEKKLTAQEEYHWSRGDGTFEAWIKPEFTPADQENTIVDVYQNYRKSLLKLVYYPKKRKMLLHIRDFGGRLKTLAASVELPAGKWSHIASCWSGKQGLALFLDGQKIASDSSFCFQAADLEHAARCDRIMPDNISLGIDAALVRRIPSKIPRERFLKGAMDKVRFSAAARYSDNFHPSRTLENDRQTCAFFDYENTFNGIHGGGDRFIAGSVLAADSPYSDTLVLEFCAGQRIFARKVQVYPKEIVPENDPRNTLPVCNYPNLPTVPDFQSGRETRVRSFSVRSGERIAFSIPEPVYMNWLEIACSENAPPLVGPILLNKNEIDIRSYGDFAETMFPGKQRLENDHLRAIRLFSFMVRSNDYFMSHQARIDEKNALMGAEYDCLRQLAGYCGFECGPLNNLTMNLFLYVLGLPASMTSGNFHSFEQVFYNGKWNLFDLSAQTYFPSRRKDDAASLEEMEEDPALLVNQNTSHFYRLCARETVRWGIAPQKRLIYTLHPGESFRIHWQNNGIYNDLQRVQPRLLASMRDCGRDVTKETGVRIVRPNESIRQLDRPFPHYASGFLRFNGIVSSRNPAFSNVTGDSFVYQVKLPYPIVAASYKAEGRNLTYELSYDRGKHWRTVPVAGNGVCRLTLEVRARNEYLLRVSGKWSGRFSAETNVQMNPRVLTGVLRRGSNQLLFKSDSSGEAKVTWSYRVDTDKKIVLGNVLDWGAIPGEEKQMVSLNPEEEYEITVSGVSPNAEILTSDGLKAKYDGNRIRLSSPEKTARLCSLTIRDGKREKRLVVAVLPGARWIPAEKMRPESGAELLSPDHTRTMPVLKSKRSGVNIVYPFSPIKAGKYMVFHIGRNPLNPPLINLVRRMENGKPGTVFVQKTNNAAEFYSTEKRLWRFRWDYPVSGLYPYQRMRALNLPAGDSMTVRCMCPGIEIAGVLLIPADDPEFLAKFRQYCCGFNYDPFLQ